MGETQYARCGELSLAYQAVGEGELDIVVAGSFVSHVELMWASPETKRFFDRLSSFARVIVFDKAGVGLSDPVPKVRTLEERVQELEAVMDATGSDGAVMFGISEGGPASMLFAATRPERVRALVLTGTFATTGIGDWTSLERSMEECGTTSSRRTERRTLRGATSWTGSGCSATRSGSGGAPARRCPTCCRRSRRGRSSGCSSA